MKIININSNSPIYPNALDIWNKVWPDYSVSIEEWKHFDDSFGSKYFLKRYIVELSGKYVATGYIGQPWWSHKPGKYQFDIAVLKEFRNQGIGSLCLEYLEKVLSDKDGNKFNVHGYEGNKDGMSFLKNRGYNIVLREPGSKLSVNEFDITKFIETEERVKKEGISIYSISELIKFDKNWQQNLYNLYCLVLKNVPINDDITLRSFEQFKKLKFEAPGYNPDAYFIALDGNKYIGLSSLLKQPSRPKEFITDLTGVLREYRRKGIAVALKVATIKYVKSINGISIETDNEENNPMYNINILLGFKPLPAWVTFEKIYQ